MVAIFKFFRVIVVHFYGPLIDRVDVCKLVDSIFNDSHSLYEAIFPANPKGARRADGSQEKKKEAIIESINFEAERRAFYTRIESESHWRQNLNVGDDLDAMSRYKTPSSTQYHFIRGWAKAKVLAADEATVTVGFLGRSRTNNIRA